MGKILIVGGAGYIGGQIAKDNPDWDVYDNLLYEKYFNLPNNFIFGDVTDAEKLQKILPNYDAVIWLAAVVGDGACALHPLLTKEVNEYSLNWLANNYKGRIIFPSTCSVYGSSDSLLSEESELNPLSLYAVTKVNSEQILLKHKNALILRLGTVFGCALRPRFDLVVNTLTAHAYLNKEIRVFGGKQWRPNIHVHDVARFMSENVFSDETGVYNIAVQNLQIVDIANIIKDNLPNTKIVITKSPFEDNRNYKADCSKLQKTFKFNFKHSVDDGVKQLLEVLRSGRIKNPFDANFHNLNYISQIGGI